MEVLWDQLVLMKFQMLLLLRMRIGTTSCLVCPTLSYYFEEDLNAVECIT